MQFILASLNIIIINIICIYVYTNQQQEDDGRRTITVAAIGGVENSLRRSARTKKLILYECE